MSFFNRYHLQWSLVFLTLGAIWIGLSSILFKPETNSALSAPQEGFLAPDFSLQSLPGVRYTLSEQEGQVVLLNIWASWCSPCKAEMPALQRVYDTYKDQGFTILAVNATPQDSLTAAVKFASEMNLTFPILVDAEGMVTSTYRVKAFPTSYFIDQSGRIQEIVIGGPMAEAYLRARIENLLSDK